MSNNLYESILETNNYLTIYELNNDSNHIDNNADLARKYLNYKIQKALSKDENENEKGFIPNFKKVINNLFL